MARPEPTQQFDEIAVPDEPGKRFTIYHWSRLNDKPIEMLAEFETVGEVFHYPWRLDRSYKIYDGVTPYDRLQFEEWVRKDYWECKLCKDFILRKNKLQLSEKCKLKDQRIGDECIARHDPRTAQDLLVELTNTPGS